MIALAIILITLATLFVAGCCRVSGQCDDAMDKAFGDLLKLPDGWR